MLTSDFLITVKQGDALAEHVLSVNPSNDLSKSRVLEKLELERQYWEKRKVPWNIVTEQDLPAALVKNLEWLYPYRFSRVLSPLTDSEIHRVRRGLEQELLRFEPLSATANAVDDRLGLEPGTSLSVTRYLLATRTWRANLFDPSHLKEPLVLNIKSCSPGIGGGCSVNWMVNQVIEWLDENGDPVTERLLWIDPIYADAYLFALLDPKAMPVWRRIQDLDGAIS